MANATELISALTDDDSRQYNRLVRRRAYYKGRLTAFETDLEDNPTPSQGSIETMLRNLTQYEIKFQEIQDELEDEFPDIEACRTEREDFFNRYFSLERTLRQKVIDNKRETSPTPTPPAVTGTTTRRATPKLPDITIQKFDGDIRKWPAWSKLWKPMIGDRCDIDDVTKLTYLEASITDPRASSVLHSVTDSNYQTAFSKLEDLYSNDVRLKQQLIADLYACKPAKERDAKSLDEFAAKIESTISFLKSLNVPTDAWDLILVFHLTQTLDFETRKDLERFKKTDEDLSLASFLKFLRRTARVLETLVDLTFTKPKATSTPRSDNTRQTQDKRKVFSGVSTLQQKSVESKRSLKCSLCSEPHRVFDCPSIKNLSPDDIYDKIKKAGHCFNCLKKGHGSQGCSSSTCQKCGKRHHTLIHSAKRDTEIKKEDNTSTSNSKKDDSANQSNVTNHATTLLARHKRNISVLPTAVILIKAKNGSFVPCRALLDSGSTICFMTNALATKLNLDKEHVNTQVHGVNDQSRINKYSATTTIRSRQSDYESQLDFLVTHTITASIPSQTFDITTWKIPESSKLADPLFHVRRSIDILLSVDVFFDVLKEEKAQMVNGLHMYDTKLGYVFGGKFEAEPHVSLVSVDDVFDQLKRFWEVEACGNRPATSLEEKAAEAHYVKYVKRRVDGHYEVALPLKESKQDLGNSELKAKRLFLSSEHRLLKDKQKQKHYQDFVEEMLQLGHLERAPEQSSSLVYYMSHHLISRPSSTTTKNRVVFNASMKTDSGLSLNDTLMTGPTIQSEIFRQLIRWRLFPVAVTADIAKMYRMVYVRAEDRDLQRIWWRADPSQPLKAYRLTTVVYGTASAPFQAIRTLSQLAEDEIDEFPGVAPLLTKRFYVDDYTDSFESPTEAQKVKHSLSELASRGGFQLRKWASNKAELDDDLTRDDDITQVLGVNWRRKDDTILLSFSNIKLHPEVTKSNVLSEIAQIYDPLGFYAPVVLYAKFLMQKLWLIAELEWDDLLPADLQQEWLDVRTQLTESQTKTVSRTLLPNTSNGFTIHGFCDASEIGYGACIYLVSHEAVLVCAKSRVAPLKSLTIPRLELCAALLLANLMHRVIASIEITPDEIFCWTDSEITLYRIKSTPARYNVFVGSRLAQIQEFVNPSHWFHVPSGMNAADIVSRGCTPNQLMENETWWNGPSFILQEKQHWPNQDKFIKFSEDSELKKTKVCALARAEQPAEEDRLDFVVRFSSFTRLINTIAYMMRFYLNCRKPSAYRDFQPLSTQETREALIRVVRLVQADAFCHEMSAMKANKPIPTHSKLTQLNPFIDEDGIVRVGGRLDNAQLSYDNQHQMIIPKGHFAQLLMQNSHERHLHAGPLATLNTVRQKWWILGGRNLSRKIVHDCVRCFQTRPVLAQQLMAQIPALRLNQARPFLVVGIDFCGPFLTRLQPRSKILVKRYICAFTCFPTRATHLEIVTDLSTEAFLQCLRRFVSRRGVPQRIMSDNATNFVGATRELKELKDWFVQEITQRQIHEFCQVQNITWTMIPPRSPHYGGLWESIIKRVKHHLKRVTKERIFNPESLSTLTCQIEACLNSRPLTPLTDSIDDYQALTPGHFLIGAPLNAIPEPTYNESNVQGLRLWQQMQFLTNEIWKRFSRDYLMELQQRHKWRKPYRNLQVNDLVLIHEQDLPPMQWRLGRIIETYPGDDGYVRVVKVATSTGSFNRSIHRLAPLPINN